MAIEVKKINLKEKELKDALKSNTNVDVIFVTSDNKAVKIIGKVESYKDIDINTLKKLAS